MCYSLYPSFHGWCHVNATDGDTLRWGVCRPSCCSGLAPVLHITAAGQNFGSPDPHSEAFVLPEPQPKAAPFKANVNTELFATLGFRMMSGKAISHWVLAIWSSWTLLAVERKWNISSGSNTVKSYDLYGNVYLFCLSTNDLKQFLEDYRGIKKKPDQ